MLSSYSKILLSKQTLAISRNGLNYLRPYSSYKTTSSSNTSNDNINNNIDYLLNNNSNNNDSNTVSNDQPSILENDETNTINTESTLLKTKKKKSKKEDLSLMTIIQLRQLCKEIGLKCSYHKKVEIIAHIENFKETQEKEKKKQARKEKKERELQEKKQQLEQQIQQLEQEQQLHQEQQQKSEIVSTKKAKKKEKLKEIVNENLEEEEEEEIKKYPIKKLYALPIEELHKICKDRGYTCSITLHKDLAKFIYYKLQEDDARRRSEKLMKQLQEQTESNDDKGIKSVQQETKSEQQIEQIIIEPELQQIEQQLVQEQPSEQEQQEQEQQVQQLVQEEQQPQQEQEQPPQQLQEEIQEIKDDTKVVDNNINQTSTLVNNEKEQQLDKRQSIIILQPSTETKSTKSKKVIDAEDSLDTLSIEEICYICKSKNIWAKGIVNKSKLINKLSKIGITSKQQVQSIVNEFHNLSDITFNSDPRMTALSQSLLTKFKGHSENIKAIITLLVKSDPSVNINNLNKKLHQVFNDSLSLNDYENKEDKIALENQWRDLVKNLNVELDQLIRSEQTPNQLLLNSLFVQCVIKFMCDSEYDSLPHVIDYYLDKMIFTHTIILSIRNYFNRRNTIPEQIEAINGELDRVYSQQKTSSLNAAEGTSFFNKQKNLVELRTYLAIHLSKFDDSLRYFLETPIKVQSKCILSFNALFERMIILGRHDNVIKFVVEHIPINENSLKIVYDYLSTSNQKALMDPIIQQISEKKLLSLITESNVKTIIRINRDAVIRLLPKMEKRVMFHVISEVIQMSETGGLREEYIELTKQGIEMLLKKEVEIKETVEWSNVLHFLNSVSQDIALLDQVTTKIISNHEVGVPILIRNESFNTQPVVESFYRSMAADSDSNRGIFIYWMIKSYLQLDRYEAALDWYARKVQLFGDSPTIFSIHIFSLYHQNIKAGDQTPMITFWTHRQAIFSLNINKRQFITNSWDRSVVKNSGLSLGKPNKMREIDQELEKYCKERDVEGIYNLLTQQYFKNDIIPHGTLLINAISIIHEDNTDKYYSLLEQPMSDRLGVILFDGVAYSRHFKTDPLQTAQFVNKQFPVLTSASPSIYFGTILYCIDIDDMANLLKVFNAMLTKCIPYNIFLITKICIYLNEKSSLHLLSDTAIKQIRSIHDNKTNIQSQISITNVVLMDMINKKDYDNALKLLGTIKDLRDGNCIKLGIKLFFAMNPQYNPFQSFDSMEALERFLNIEETHKQRYFAALFDYFYENQHSHHAIAIMNVYEQYFFNIKEYTLLSSILRCIKSPALKVEMFRRLRIFLQIYPMSLKDEISKANEIVMDPEVEGKLSQMNFQEYPQPAYQDIEDLINNVLVKEFK